MKCPRCQHENPADMRFCGECGARLAAACVACGAGNPSGNKFCGKCGAPLTEARAEPGARFTSPEAYTPKHLAEKILTSRAALEGERKQVTVLFADLKGSMELLADRDPEEARTLLDPVLELMMEAVHRYEGTVNQVMGDGIMALFGAPLAHEDHAVRACYAALRMQEGMRRYNEGVRRAHGIEVQLRVGLNSGEVVVRSIGSDLRMDYTAVGHTTHLAARMEQLASPGTVRLTTDTLRLVEGYVEARPLGAIPVKGLTEPVEVHELAGGGWVQRRFEVAAGRGLTRFTGRDSELSQLLKAQDLAAKGHGQVVAVVGEPGVGKSRLFFELTHSPRRHGWLVLETGAVSYGQATPYLAVRELLKAYFQIEAHDEARRTREKVSGKLVTLDEALLPLLPVFLALLDMPVEDPQWQALDPPQRRYRMLGAVKRLLLRESQAQPLALVCEDLHWIDSETQAVLDGLVESLPTARVLLLVNYRPEYWHGWSGKTYYRQLQLPPLPPESAEEVLEALLGGDPGLARLKALLIERTEGNPFFLEESVRTLVETRVLTGARGGHSLARPVEAIQVPTTVQALLAARIDRLPPEDKRLLQSAAVVGHEVPFALLQAIAERPEEELRRGLAQLQAAEFLYETRLFPDLEYTFKHALTYEVAYGSLLQDRRRTLHARIMEALERLYPDRLMEHVERLAHHALRGEVWEKAAAFFHQAGRKAAARSANREAVACFDQALEALRHLPEGRTALEQAVDLRLDLRNALFPLGEFEQIFDRLREAEPLAQRLDDRRRLGFVCGYTATHFWVRGEPDRAVAWGERALALAEALGDLTLEVTTRFRLGLAHHFRGDYPRAMELLRRNVAVLDAEHLVRERFGEPGLPSVMSRCWLVYCLAERGEFADGLATASGGLEIATMADHPFSLLGASVATGFLYLRRGDLPNATTALERGVRLSETWNIPLWWPGASAALGLVYALTGRAAEGLPLLERARERAASMRHLTNYGLWATYLAEGRLLSNHVDQALEVARHAVEFGREHKARGQQAWALRIVGEIASRREPPEVAQARDHYGQALGLAERLGMRPLAAHCHLGLGKLYGRTGQRDQARAHLTTAATMYRAMDMRFWLEPAEAALKGTGGQP